jgi:asparagine synthase (glutamine-hydrolysing)
MGSARNFYVASELKALEGYALKFNYFLRTLYDSKMEFVQWYKRLDRLRGCKDNETNIQDIKVALEAAVHR